MFWKSPLFDPFLKNWRRPLFGVSTVHHFDSLLFEPSTVNDSQESKTLNPRAIGTLGLKRASALRSLKIIEKITSRIGGKNRGAIHVVDQNGLRVSRPIVETGALVTIVAGANFEVERTVYSEIHW